MLAILSPFPGDCVPEVLQQIEAATGCKDAMFPSLCLDLCSTYNHLDGFSLGNFPESGIINESFANTFSVDVFMWGRKLGFSESFVKDCK